MPHAERASPPYSFPFGDFQPDAAVAEQLAGRAEHWLAADLEFLLRAIGIDAVEDEVEERPPLGNGSLQLRALLFVPAVRRGAWRVAECIDPQAEHLEHR